MHGLNHVTGPIGMGMSANGGLAVISGDDAADSPSQSNFENYIVSVQNTR